MKAVALTPAEWEWFKQLARPSAVTRVPPIGIRRKLVDLLLIEEKRGSGLGPTTQGRDVLKLIDERWRVGYQWRKPRRCIVNSKKSALAD